jgi:hypothetical protein
MSHFSVMVITPTKPSEDDLANILQPWHEYECTDIEDEYVVEVDVTNDVKGGMEEELKNGMTLAEAAEQWTGGYVREGRAYKKTNPNKKWDWWQLGGRFSGLLAANYDPNTDPKNIETCFICGGTGVREVGKNGCNGCNGTGKSTKWPTNWKVVGAQCRRGELELEALRNYREAGELREYDKWQRIIDGRELPDWETLVEKNNKDYTKAREEFGNHPVIKELYEKGWHSFSYPLEDLQLAREQISENARADAVCTYALVKDGQWFQRGEMGWWGMSRDEMDRNEWRTKVAVLLDEMDTDHWISIVDCHI